MPEVRFVRNTPHPYSSHSERGFLRQPKPKKELLAHRSPFQHLTALSPRELDLMFNLNLSHRLQVTAHIYGRLLLPARCDLHQVRLPSYPLSLFSLSLFFLLSPSSPALSSLSPEVISPLPSLHSRMASFWGSVVILSL